MTTTRGGARAVNDVIPTSSRRRARAVLCLLLACAFAGYLLYWFMFALDMARMEAVAEWGREHGIVWERVRPGGHVYISPGQVLHPYDLQLSP
jgi:hypothetical protein